MPGILLSVLVKDERFIRFEEKPEYSTKCLNTLPRLILTAIPEVLSLFYRW